MPNKLKEMFRQKQVAYGVWIEFLDPDLIEVAGYCGFDYAMIDGEHTALDRSNCTELIRACDAVGIVPIVRVADNDPHIMLGYLEMGAKGIYVPHVNTGAEAAQIVDSVKYAPEGHRGAGSMRGVQYGLTAEPQDSFKRANEEIMTIALVEELQGIEALDDILAVDGIDVVGIGDGDLSHTMGHVGDKGHPDVRRVVLDAEARIAASAKVFDAVVTDVDAAKEAVDRGCLMVSVAVRGMLTEAFRGFLGNVRG